ncbi:MAG: LVIVD repeat-containing protein [Thermoplasmatota archaeon]
MRAFLLLFLLVAGCVAPVDYAPLEARVDAAAAPFLVEDHGVPDGHHVGSLHNASYNLALEGYSNGVDQSQDANRIGNTTHYTEIALAGHYVYLNRASPDGATGGFVVIDVNDTKHPRVVGEFRGQSGYDIELNPEGDLAFFASQRDSPAEEAGAAMAGASATGRGVVAVDVSDPHHPLQVGYLPIPYNGAHTITYVRHPTAGNLLVVCTYDLYSTTVPGQPGVFPATQRVLLYRIDDRVLPSGRSVTFTPLSTYQFAAAAPAPFMALPHDVRVQVHPRTGQVLLYVAYWDLGVRIVDMTDPANLHDVSSWTDFSPSEQNNIHLAQPFADPIAGRDVTVAEPEIITAQGETGQVTLLDTTDPAHPAKLGHWTLPPGTFGQLGVSDLDFSPHNFDLWPGHIGLAHYHAGVWVLDVHDAANLAHPRATAFYMPHVSRTHPPVLDPDVWGVRARADPGGELLFASDQATGLHILRYTGP